MVNFTVDRLAGVLSLDLDKFNEDEIWFPEFVNYIYTIFQDFAPDDVTFDNYAGSSFAMLKVVNEYRSSEPLLRIDYINYGSPLLRLDWNPKRFRDSDSIWALNALNYLFNAFRTSDLINMWPFLYGTFKISQVDIACDLISDGSDLLTPASIQTLKIYRAGRSVSQIMTDRAGNLSTEYIGKRGSTDFLRRYDKLLERRNALVTKFKVMKMRIEKELSWLTPAFDFNDSLLRDKLINHYFTGGYQDVYAVDEINDYDTFVSALALELEAMKQFELEQLPESWWRFEFVQRLTRLDVKNVDGFNYVFDIENIDNWLNSLTSDSYATCSDPVIRSLLVAHSQGLVSKKELPQSLKSQMIAVSKWSDVSVIVSGHHLKCVKTESLKGDEIVRNRITRDSSDDLINLIKSEWAKQYNDLLVELNSFLIEIKM